MVFNKKKIYIYIVIRIASTKHIVQQNKSNFNLQKVKFHKFI